jgi:hypothetical protein
MISLTGLFTDDDLNRQGHRLTWGEACEIREQDLEAHRELRELRRSGVARYALLVELATKILMYRKLIEGFAEAHLMYHSKGVRYIP